MGIQFGLCVRHGGFPDDGQPIYEIGITSALLKSLKTEDQVAFVLGHELKHLSEGHTDSSHQEDSDKMVKKWWSSQSNEAVADEGGLTRLLGKYELEAALDVMETLHPADDAENLEIEKAVYRAVEHSVAAHHSAGVRTSIIQARIQQLRGSDERAKPRPQIKLPEFIRNDFQREAQVRFKQQESVWLQNVEMRLDKLEKEPRSKSHNIWYMLDVLLDPPRAENPFLLLNDQLKYRLKNFLVLNSTGTNAWTLADYYNDSITLAHNSERARTNFLLLFLGNEGGRKFIADLSKLSPVWGNFISYWSSIQSFNDGKSFLFHELVLYAKLLEQSNPLHLSEADLLRQRSELLKNISEASSEIFYQPDARGTIRFYDFVNNKLEDSALATDDPSWIGKLKKAFEPHIKSHIPTALAKIRQDGILSCSKCVSFFKFFNHQQLNEALNILEDDLTRSEEPITSEVGHVDTAFLVVQLFKKYQHDANKTLELIRRFHPLHSKFQPVKEVMAIGLSLLPRQQILDFVSSPYIAIWDVLPIWFGTTKGKEVFASLSVAEMNLLIQRLPSKYTHIGVHAEPFFELLASHLLHFQDSKELINIYVSLIKSAGKGFALPPNLQRVFRDPLKKALDRLSVEERLVQLKQVELWQILGADYVGQQAAIYAHQLKRKTVPEKIDTTMSEIPLKEEWSEAFRFFRDKLAELAQVQPSEVHSVFPQDDKSETEKAKEYNSMVRGLSAFSSFVKDLSYAQQLEIIEFMMGRQNEIPAALKTASSFINKRTGETSLKSDMMVVFLQLKEKLQFKSALERAFAVNTVLAGNKSILSSQEGLQVVIDQILKPVSEQNRNIARTILNALLKAEGKNKTLILSYVLAQKNSGSESQMTEAMVLRSLLDFYGVPGVKLAQYLAFTSEFKTFQSALESYQNAAMPISFYDALLLIQKSLGSKWDPSLYRITKILGSGSVNIAIEYQNLKTGVLQVLTISRDKIETKTKEDFRRFHLLINALMATEDKAKFEYLTGLLRLIERSVSLEFDKHHAYKMQKGVQSLYRQNVDGWKVQSVDAFEVINNEAIRMEKAPGFGALQILNENPKMYESAMRALMTVEYGILRGASGQNTSPIPMYANPDFHDGQVLIDPVTKTVTIIDFGQAMEISNAERDFALDVLSIISKAEGVSSALRLLQKNIKTFSGKDIYLDSEEVRKILAKKDKMEVFVHLFSYLERQGFEAPLSVVHWLLGANRLSKLGQKVHVPIESSFAWLIGMRKIGLSLSAFNGGKKFLEKFAGSSHQVKSTETLPTGAAASQLKCYSLFE